MKKLLVGLFVMFVCGAHGQTETINWYVDNDSYAQTTCETGGDVVLPTAPTKYGYTFQGWYPAYTFIEYIETTGTQYINTGLRTNNGDITATAVFAPTSFVLPDDVGAYFAIFGYDGQFQAAYTPTGHASVGNIETNNVFFIKNVKNTVTGVLSANTAGGLYVDGAFTGLSRTFIRRTNLLLLAAAHPLRYPAIGKLYSFVAVQNGLEIMHLVPALRNVDGITGMFDTVTGTFFTNYGTGEFIAGPVIQQ